MVAITGGLRITDGSITNIKLKGTDLTIGGHYNIPLQDYNAIVAGSWVLNPSPDSIYCILLMTGGAAAVGDEINYLIYLAKGTYTLRSVMETNNNEGIIQVKLDSTVVDTIDMYSAANTYNVVKTTTGIVVSTSGMKTLTLYLSSKNGASSNYFTKFNLIGFWRTV